MQNRRSRLLVVSCINLTVALVLQNGNPIHAGVINESLELMANDRSQQDRLGHSAAVHRNTVIIGTQDESAYVFDVTAGEQLQKLTADNARMGDSFGISVGIWGSKAIVGAPYGNQNGKSSGSAYLFSVDTGKQIAELHPNDARELQRFGQSVAMNNSIAVIGAPGDDANGENSGAAYLFDTSTGIQLLKLLPLDGTEGQRFGSAAAIDNAHVIVSAPSDDENGPNTGAVYLFDAHTGAQIYKLQAIDNTSGVEFGFSVAIDGSRAVVGAPHWFNQTGAAFLFDVNTGQQLVRLNAPNSTAQSYSPGMT